MRTKLIVEIDIEFILLAVSCHQMDYRFCWGLNNQLNIQLKKQEDYTVEVYKSKHSSFSMYSYLDDIQKIHYHVIANKGSDALLAKEYAMMDYFIILDGYHESIDKEVFLANVKKTPSVLTATWVDPNQMHSKNNFILE